MTWVEGLVSAAVIGAIVYEAVDAFCDGFFSEMGRDAYSALRQRRHTKMPPP